jgi:hypothetical protein
MCIFYKIQQKKVSVMIDVRCDNCEPNEFGGFYCVIERKEFGNCEKCPFNTVYLDGWKR